ncbi:MAG: hypothetical protein LBS60_04210 [Deltaproteobacteria bacterium]|jgi:hypothetical protein|nr:hypothetical protein [Deltaproteobacteria bacterium]
MTPRPATFPQLSPHKNIAFIAKITIIVILTTILTTKSESLAANIGPLNAKNLINALKEEIIGPKGLIARKNILSRTLNQANYKERIVIYKLSPDKPSPLNLGQTPITASLVAPSPTSSIAPSQPIRTAYGWDVLAPVEPLGPSLDPAPEDKWPITKESPPSLAPLIREKTVKPGLKIEALIREDHSFSGPNALISPRTKPPLTRPKARNYGYKNEFKPDVRRPKTKGPIPLSPSDLRPLPRGKNPKPLVSLGHINAENPPSDWSVKAVNNWRIQSLTSPVADHKSEGQVARITLYAPTENAGTAPPNNPTVLGVNQLDSGFLERLIALQIIGNGSNDQDLLKTLWPDHYGRFKGRGSKEKRQGGLYLKSQFNERAYLEFGALTGRMDKERKVINHPHREGQRPQSHETRTYQRAFLAGAGVAIKTNFKGAITGYGRVIWRRAEEDTIIRRLRIVRPSAPRSAQTQVGLKVSAKGESGQRSFVALALDYDLLSPKNKLREVDPLTGFPRRKGPSLLVETGWGLRSLNGRRSLEFLVFAKAGGKLSLGGLLGYTFIF